MAAKKKAPAKKAERIPDWAAKAFAAGFTAPRGWSP